MARARSHPQLRERLLGAGVEPSALDDVDRVAQELIDAATEEAQAAPPPDPVILLWADGGSAWRN